MKSRYEARNANRAQCEITGCAGRVEARGWCSLHYQRWKRHGDPNGGRHYKKRAAKPAVPCSVDGCPQFARTRGFCGTHYARWQKSGDPGTAELKFQRYFDGMAEKRCTACGEVKPRDDFNRVNRPGRYVARCKPCRAIEVAKHQRRRLYGVTDEQYRQMVDAQSGACAVCGSTQRLCIDHNHATGAIRELLCDPCNKVLGLAAEDPTRLRGLAAYLEKHSTDD